MSKVVLNDVAAGYNVSTINSNFDKIETALNNKVLYRDNPTGEPNELKSDLDFNGKNAYNVGTLGVSSIEIGGVSLEPGDAVTNATIQPFEFTATAGQTQFSVSPFTPTTTALLVEVNGISIPTSSVATSGSTVTIPACELGDEVIIRVFTRAVGGVSPATGDNVSFVQSGAGAVTRNVQSKLREIVSVKDFGAVGDGVTNDTTAIQNAINSVSNVGGSYTLYFPEGTYKLTAPLNITTALRIVGDGCSPYVTNTGNRGGGSWLYFAHTGRGISVDGTGMLSGIVFEQFGTFRDQPTPAPAWSPNAHDYDIWVDNADVTIDEVTLLNPTKGFKLVNTQAGRLTIKRLRGQPLQIGLDIDECYDLPQIANVHFWPYWQDNANVHAYTMANLDAIYLRRVDNPQITNAFTIFARAGVRITQSAAGSVSKLLLANCDFDRGAFGLWIDSTVTSMTATKVVNFSCYGETGLAGSKAIFVQGSNCSLQLENIGTENHNQNAIRVEGTGNFVSVGNADFSNWNQSGSGFPAIEASNGNTVQVSQPPRTTGGGGAAVYGTTTGTIYADDLWMSYTPTVTAQTGSITTLGAVAARYKRRGSLVDVIIDITITTNGTGAGDVRFTLPFTSAGFSNGAGREIALTGNATSLQATVASNVCQIIRYDNAYPGASGARLVGLISYRV